MRDDYRRGEGERGRRDWREDEERGRGRGRDEPEQWGAPGMGGRMDWRHQGYDPYSAESGGWGSDSTWRDWDRDRPWRSRHRGMGEHGGGFYAGYPEERYYRGDFGGEHEEREHREHRGLGERIKQMFRGRGPKGYTRSDERIREDVNDRLTDHPSIDATDITVQVREGEVTLEGHVDSRYVKRLAEEVVEDVSGVKDVMNHLRVRRQQQTTATETETEGNGRRRAEMQTGSGVVRR